MDAGEIIAMVRRILGQKHVKVLQVVRAYVSPRCISAIAQRGKEQHTYGEKHSAGNGQVGQAPTQHSGRRLGLGRAARKSAVAANRIGNAPREVARWLVAPVVRLLSSAETRSQMGQLAAKLGRIPQLVFEAALLRRV